MKDVKTLQEEQQTADMTRLQYIKNDDELYADYLDWLKDKKQQESEESARIFLHIIEDKIMTDDDLQPTDEQIEQQVNQQVNGDNVQDVLNSLIFH